jgi:FMN-dependent NADH-azoreductase
MTTKELILQQAEKIHLELKQNLQSLKRVALSEAWKNLQLVTASVIQIIEAVARDLEGKEKKEIAIEYINNFYDKVFIVIDIPLVPSILEPIIHRYIKKILMIMVSASIDATVTIFRETGVFLKKGTV